MNKSELNNQLFDTVLKAAVAEDFQQELDALPPEDKLKKEYEPTRELKQKIEKMIRKDNRDTVLRKFAKTAKKVAVVAAIMIPVSLGSLLSVEASRNEIFNSVLEWKADHVDIYFQQDSKNQQNIDENSAYKPVYVPDGFVESESAKFGTTRRIKYQNEENVTIIFEQLPLSKEGIIGVDTENTMYKQILLNGQKASLFEAKTPNNTNYILWQVGKTSFKLSSRIDSKELIKMAESVEIQKK